MMMRFSIVSRRKLVDPHRMKFICLLGDFITHLYCWVVSVYFSFGVCMVIMENYGYAIISQTAPFLFACLSVPLPSLSHFLS